MRLSSVMYQGMFDTVEIVVADKIKYKSSMKGNTELEKSVLPFMNNQDFLSSAVSFRSQMYKSGDIVVLETYNPDEHKAGLGSVNLHLMILFSPSLMLETWLTTNLLSTMELHLNFSSACTTTLAAALTNIYIVLYSRKNLIW